MKFRTKIHNFSGVYPLALYMKPIPCSCKCLYCFHEVGFPNSYLKNEDTLLAKSVKYNSKLQISLLLKRLQHFYNNIQKIPIEIIILGGTFSDYPIQYRFEFLKGVYEGLNNNTYSSFYEARENNRFSNYRCAVLTIETRPDCISENEINLLLKFGVTKVELGIQSLNDSILKMNNRKYDYATIRQVTKTLKEYGFKVGYHIMIGIPHSNIEAEVDLFNKKLWTELIPDYLKIYPFVFLGSKYHRFLKSYKFAPYTYKRYLNALIEIKKKIPPYVKISRIGRQLNNGFRFDRNQISRIANCQCIRCKEPFGKEKIKFDDDVIEHTNINNDIFLIHYDNFKKYIVGILRAYNTNKQIIVRELKVFGKAAIIGSRANVQGKGIGMKLLSIAEGIAQKGKKRILILPSAGTLPYYEKLKYKRLNQRTLYVEKHDCF